MADQIDVQAILDKLSQTDLGKNILDVLNASGKVPNIQQNAAMEPGTYGTFSPATKELKLSSSLNNLTNTAKNVLPHELTHAANSVLVEAAGRDSDIPSKTKAEINKFYAEEPINPIQQVIKKAGKSSYRQRSDESLAFGVANTLSDEMMATTLQPVNHADATKAQEFAIMSDLFLRAVKQQKGKK